MMDYTPDLAGILALFIQVILPLLVGLVTRASTSASAKAVLLLGLTGATQFLTAWLDHADSPAGDPFNWRMVAWNVLIGFALSVVTHFGLWRPTGATAAVQAAGPADRELR